MPRIIGPPFVRWPFGKETLRQLFVRGCNEIPEVMGAGLYGVIGLGMILYGTWDYYRKEQFNRRYKIVCTIYRPDDERISRIRKFPNSPQPTCTPPAVRQLYGQCD